MISRARKGTKVKLVANPEFANERVAKLFEEEIAMLGDAVHAVAMARGNMVVIRVNGQAITMHKCALEYAA